MAGMGIMVGICTSPYPYPYPIEKVGDFPYPYLYPYPINAGIPRQNGDGFGQYPQGRVYLPSLVLHHRHTLYQYLCCISTCAILVFFRYSKTDYQFPFKASRLTILTPSYFPIVTWSLFITIPIST